MKFFTEFKKFAVRGNMVDLAVGIIVGAAFNSIINSLVSDIVMPPIGLLVGNVDFSNLYVNLSGVEYESLEAAQAAGAPTINYGLFINALISFLITAFVVYLAVRFINRIRSQEKEEPQQTPETRACPHCFKEVSRKASKCAFCTADIAPIRQ